MWRNCAPEIVDADPFARLPYKTIMKLDQMKCNPFADRLIEHFSPYRDNSMTFDDYINMFSLLSSEKGTAEFKIFLVFQIYGLPLHF